MKTPQARHEDNHHLITRLLGRGPEKEPLQAKPRHLLKKVRALITRCYLSEALFQHVTMLMAMRSVPMTMMKLSAIVTRGCGLYLTQPCHLHHPTLMKTFSSHLHHPSPRPPPRPPLPSSHSMMNRKLSACALMRIRNPKMLSLVPLHALTLDMLTHCRHPFRRCFGIQWYPLKFRDLFQFLHKQVSRDGDKLDPVFIFSQCCLC